MIHEDTLVNILKAVLLSRQQPLTIKAFLQLFEIEEKPSEKAVKLALDELSELLKDDVLILRQLASGYVLQVRQEYAEWITKLAEEKPPRYSRAFLETLSIIAYRQPVTRADIEAIRGVGVSSGIMKTLQERDWIRIIGHRDLPGKPAIYGTTDTFLDYFNCQSLSDLPPIGDIKELDEEAIDTILEEALCTEALSEPESEDPALDHEIVT